MAGNFEGGSFRNIKTISSVHGWVRRVIAADFTVPLTDPSIQLIDPGAADRTITLPFPVQDATLYIVVNVSASKNLSFVDPNGHSIASPAAPGSGGIFVGTPYEYHLIGEIGGVAIQGIISSDNSITSSVVGPNFNLVVNPVNVDHDLLLHFVANKHIDHSTVSITAGTGLAGGGNITTTRTISIDPSNATSLAPVLGDSVNFFSVSAAGPRKTTFTGLNAILDHDVLVNFVANKHIDHSLVSISGGNGISGGGNITASRSLSLDIHGLTVTGSIGATSEFPVWNSTDSTVEKVTVATLNGALSAALTKVDDTNVTLTLGGSPNTALLQATSLTLGWTGTLAATRGGTGTGTYTLGDTLYSSGTNALAKLAGNTTTAKQYLSQTGNGSISAAPAWATVAGADITGAALTKTDDTNVTATLGGTPSTALLRAASITLGWTGTLAVSRGGIGVGTLTNHGILLGQGTSAIVATAVMTDGQVLVGQSAADPLPKTLSGDVSSISAAGSVSLAATVVKTNVTSTATVGYTFTPNNIGTVSSGTTTPNPALGNYQFYTNNGAHTLAAPSSDCAIDILVTNGASAGSITFSGFTVGASTGDALTTTNTSKFIIAIRRINAVSTYVIKALQ